MLWVLQIGTFCCEKVSTPQTGKAEEGVCPRVVQFCAHRLLHISKTTTNPNSLISICRLTPKNMVTLQHNEILNAILLINSDCRQFTVYLPQWRGFEEIVRGLPCKRPEIFYKVCLIVITCRIGCFGKTDSIRIVLDQAFQTNDSCKMFG